MPDVVVYAPDHAEELLVARTALVAVRFLQEDREVFVPATQAEEAVVDALRKGEEHAEEVADALAVFHRPHKIFEHDLVVGHYQLRPEDFQGEEQRGDAVLAA